MNVNEQALAFALAIENKAIKLRKVTQWADNLIKSTDNPSIELIEVSLSKTKPEALSALHKFSHIENEELSIQMLFSIFIYALNENLISTEQVSKALYFLAINEQTPHTDASEEMYYYWDAIDLAKNGTYGNPHDIESNMLLFLSKYANDEIHH